MHCVNYYVHASLKIYISIPQWAIERTHGLGLNGMEELLWCMVLNMSAYFQKMLETAKKEKGEQHEKKDRAQRMVSHSVCISAFSNVWWCNLECLLWPGCCICAMIVCCILVVWHFQRSIALLSVWYCLHPLLLSVLHRNLTLSVTMSVLTSLSDTDVCPDCWLPDSSVNLYKVC